MDTPIALDKVDKAAGFVKTNYITQHARELIKVGEPDYDFEVDPVRNSRMFFLPNNSLYLVNYISIGAKKSVRVLSAGKLKKEHAPSYIGTSSLRSHPIRMGYLPL